MCLATPCSRAPSMRWRVLAWAPSRRPGRRGTASRRAAACCWWMAWRARWALCSFVERVGCCSSLRRQHGSPGMHSSAWQRAAMLSAHHMHPNMASCLPPILQQGYPAAASPDAVAALACLLPLVCADVRAAAAGEPLPQVGRRCRARGCRACRAMLCDGKASPCLACPGAAELARDDESRLQPSSCPAGCRAGVAGQLGRELSVPGPAPPRCRDRPFVHACIRPAQPAAAH